MSQNQSSPLSRRRLFAGAGGVGVLAAATAVLPTLQPAAPAPTPKQPAPTEGGGYQLSEHVQRYYQTTRV